MKLYWQHLPLGFLAVSSDRLTKGQEPEAPFNTALVDTVTKGSAGISDLLEIETRESFPYTNCITQLISSSSSGSWSRIAGSQQFNIKTCVCLLPVLLAFIGLTDGAQFCDFLCEPGIRPVICTLGPYGVEIRFSNQCNSDSFACRNPLTRKLKKNSYIHFNGSAHHKKDSVIKGTRCSIYRKL